MSCPEYQRFKTLIRNIYSSSNKVKNHDEDVTSVFQTLTHLNAQAIDIKGKSDTSKNITSGATQYL